MLWSKVSFETSFDSKQPKLEPKLASALSKTKRLFRLFRFYTETESFNVSIEPKQTEDQQFDREHSLLFFTEILGFSVFFVFFGLFWNSLFRLFSFYTETESFDVSIEPKQTEDPPKQFKREYIWVFFRKFRVVLVCFSLLRNRSVCFSCFNIGSKHWNKPNFLFFGFTKQTRNRSCFSLFRFEPKFIFVCFENTLTYSEDDGAFVNQYYNNEMVHVPLHFKFYQEITFSYLDDKKQSGIWISSSFWIIRCRLKKSKKKSGKSRTLWIHNEKNKSHWLVYLSTLIREGARGKGVHFLFVQQTLCDLLIVEIDTFPNFGALYGLNGVS